MHLPFSYSWVSTRHILSQHAPPIQNHPPNGTDPKPSLLKPIPSILKHLCQWRRRCRENLSPDGGRGVEGHGDDLGYEADGGVEACVGDLHEDVGGRGEDRYREVQDRRRTVDRRPALV